MLDKGINHRFICAPLNVLHVSGSSPIHHRPLNGHFQRRCLASKTESFRSYCSFLFNYSRLLCLVPCGPLSAIKSTWHSSLSHTPPPLLSLYWSCSLNYEYACSFLCGPRQLSLSLKKDYAYPFFFFFCSFFVTYILRRNLS